LAASRTQIVYDFTELPRQAGVTYVDGSGEMLSADDKVTDEDRAASKAMGITWPKATPPVKRRQKPAGAN